MAAGTQRLNDSIMETSSSLAFFPLVEFFDSGLQWIGLQCQCLRDTACSGGK